MIKLANTFLHYVLDVQKYFMLQSEINKPGTTKERKERIFRYCNQKNKVMNRTDDLIKVLIKFTEANHEH